MTRNIIDLALAGLVCATLFALFMSGFLVWWLAAGGSAAALIISAARISGLSKVGAAGSSSAAVADPVPASMQSSTAEPTAEAAQETKPAPGSDPIFMLEVVIAALPDPMLVLDSQDIVIACNSLAMALFETDPRGQHVSSAIRAPAVLEALETLTAGTTQRVEITRPVPVEQSFEVFITQLGSATPNPGSRMIMLRDMTREQKAERMRSDFVANASHELRTPLASVLGLIETLQGAAKSDETARTKFLELMRSQAARMSRLIDELLTLNRIEMNLHLRPTGEVDLNRTLRHVVEYLKPMARDNGVELMVDLPPVPLQVQGDHDELIQVFQNLIENAIKYGGQGKRVEVSARQPGTRSDGALARMIEVSVRDFGPGIAPEHIPRLTERFYRVSVQDSRLKGGTGLGLSIVKHILNRHRGKLVVKSTLGEGSSFTVRLPRNLGDER